MGLDVYVGSLTRYYVEGPADVVDRVARHQGVTPDGQAPEEVIRSAVLRWRDGLNRWLVDRSNLDYYTPRYDPAYQAASARGAGSRYNQLLTPELWLPCRFDFTVRTPDITGEKVEVGSSLALLDQLELLAARYRLDGRPPEPADGHSLAAAAGAGLAVLLRLAERSVVSRVPMRLDF